MRIGDLRKFLAEEEAKWAASDEYFLGKFEDQEVIVPAFSWNRPKFGAKDGAFNFEGYTPDLNVYWDITGLGVIIEDKQD